MSRTKPYSLRFITQQLKKQGVWVNFSNRDDTAWFYFQNGGVIRTNVKLSVKKDCFFPKLTVSHEHPFCLHHEYIHSFMDQQDIDDLPIIAMQLMKLKDFDFGGTPQEYREKIDK